VGRFKVMKLVALVGVIALAVGHCCSNGLGGANYDRAEVEDGVLIFPRFISS
jgi:hypothetical protein